ncbi:MAG: PD40 domain-containing protein [Acidobacteria bacterium]|nr:PD40 domain-containing protein [Acidobacteriota bacterium]
MKHNEGLISECLARVLISPEFERAGRLRSFLEYVVQETLAGRGGEIKEYSVGVAVYKKPHDFDPRTDAVVRVGATKLRARLETYYSGNGKADLIRISIPKGAYEPAFVEQHTEEPRPRPVRWPGIAAIVLVLGVLGTALYSRGTRERSLPARLTKVASEAAKESSPSFSPDGSAIAFSGEMHAPGNEDIYIRKLGSDSMLRLTSDPARDSQPAWSPDGGTVAFIRNEGYGGAVYLVASTGGPERKLAHVNMGGLAWTADGKYLAALHRPSQLDLPTQLLIDVSTGATRPLTATPTGWIDYAVRFSPDGKSAAMIRCRSYSRCDLYVGELRKDYTIIEPMRRLTRLNSVLQGAAWTGDSRTILFVSGYYTDYKLYRIDAQSPDALPQRIAGVPSIPHYPSIPLRGPGSMSSVAFRTSSSDENLWAALIPEPGRVPLPPRPIASSPRSEWQPELSPDGAHLVFLSDREGSMQIWISKADGSDPHPLPKQHCTVTLYPHWSPDGEEIVFACFTQTDEGEDRAIYTMKRDGTYFLRVSPPGMQATEPSWSRDGKWIYYGATMAPPQHQIWKSRRGGGSAVQVTKSGGYRAIEAGGVLYYTATGNGVWAVSVEGGEERKVLPEAHDNAWHPWKGGILFTTRVDGKPGYGKELAHWNATTGVIRKLGPLPHPDLLLFTVNPAGTEIIYHRTDRQMQEIVFLDNYQVEASGRGR